MADDEATEQSHDSRPVPQPTRPNPGVPETYGMGWPFERKPKDKKKKKAR